MAQSVGSLIRLCWIVCWLLPFVVQCQFGGDNGDNSINRFSGGGGGGGDRGAGFGRGRGRGRGGFGSGNRNRFGQGFNGRPNGQDFGDNSRSGNPNQTAQEQDPVESQAIQSAVSSSIASEVSQSTIDIAAIVSTAVPASGDEPQAVAAPQLQSSSAVLAAAPTEDSQAIDPALVPTAIPGQASSTPVVVATPIITSDVDAGTVTEATAPAPTQDEADASSTTVATVEETIVVTATPVPDSQVQPSAVPAASTATTATPLDLAPLSTSPGTTMSASARAGVGVGVTFGLLAAASIIGIFLWRRRRNRRFDSSSADAGGMGGFFMLNSRKSDRDDPEWSVHSAEKVEIVRGASPRSVRTGSRSDSPVSGEGRRGSDRTEVLRVGMQLPDRPRNIALSSNPVVSRKSIEVPTSREAKKSSWPLPD